MYLACTHIISGPIHHNSARANVIRHNVDDDDNDDNDDDDDADTRDHSVASYLWRALEGVSVLCDSEVNNYQGIQTRPTHTKKYQHKPCYT